MKRFYYVLLGIGIVLTLLSAYFLTIDNVYAIFSATLGVLIVGFSVFEIILLKKRGERTPTTVKSEKAIASSVKKKKEEPDMEWTYYDVGETKREKEPEEVKPVLKHTFFSNLLHKAKLKDHAKIIGKDIEKETQIESKKFIKKDDKEKDKLKLLRNYIQTSLNNKIPRLKIMEACLASGWPKEKVELVLSEFLDIHKKKHFKILYVLLPVTVLLFIGLKITDNYLLGYWIDSVKSFSIFAYWGLWFFIAAMFLIFGLDVKEKLSKKNKVYKILKEEKVSKIKTEMKGKEESTVSIGGGYKTDIDKLLDLVNEKERLAVDEVGSIFGISKEEAEEWGKILKDEGLIALYYPTVGDVELRCKKKEIVEEEE